MMRLLSIVDGQPTVRPEVLHLKLTATRATYIRDFKDLENPYIVSKLYSGEATISGQLEEERFIEMGYSEKFISQPQVEHLSEFFIGVENHNLIIIYKVRGRDSKETLVLPLLTLNYLLLLGPIHPLRDYL